MTRADDEHRRLWQDATREGTLNRGDACPTAEELAAALAGEASPPEREAVADHLVRCAACSAVAQEHDEIRRWAAEAAIPPAAAAPPEARGTDPARSGDGEPPAPPAPAARGDSDGGHRRSRTRSRRWLALAAGLAVVALAAWAAWQALLPLSPTPPGTGSGTAAPGSTDVQRGASAGVLPGPGAVLAAPPQRLAWPAEPGASGYRVRLYDERAGLLWVSSTVEEPEVEVDPAVVRRIGPAGGYSWSVEVTGPARRGELGPFWFYLEAAP